MAINRNRTKELISEVNELFEYLPGNAKTRDWIKDKVMGPAFEEVEKMLVESRPPVLFVVGRTRHGKSALINRMAGKIVTTEKPGPESENYKATSHLITFEETFASWNVIDTRGLFESATGTQG